MPKTNKSVVYVKRAARPSRFLVDLPTMANEQTEVSLEKPSQWQKIKTGLYKKTNIKNSIGGEAKTNEYRNNFINEKTIGYTSVNTLAVHREPRPDHNIYRRMLFYPLLSAVFLLGKWLLRLCYFLGWTLIFILRFLILGASKGYSIFKKNKIKRLGRTPELMLEKDGAPVREIMPTAVAYATGLHLEQAGREGDSLNTTVIDYAGDKQDSRGPILDISGTGEKILPEPSAIADEEDEDLRLILKEIEREDGADLRVTEPKEKIITGGDRPNRAFSIKNLIPIPRLKFIRGVIYFSLFLLIFTLPLKALTYYKELTDLKGRVLGVSETAAEEILKGVKSISDSNFNEAGEHFSEASAQFGQAREEIGNLRYLFELLSKVAPYQSTKMAGNAGLVLDSGKLSAELAQELNLLLSSLGAEKLGTAQIIDDIYLRSLTIKQLAEKLLDNVEAIDPEGLPDEYQNIFIEIQGKTRLLEASLRELVDLARVLKIFLGFEEDKRYLLVFQNNSEMRASGGFFGSYALVDFHNGEIKNLEVPEGGTYDSEAGLKEKIASPEALSLVSPRWYLWDANWWPDWLTSAEKIMWFYERSGGSTVDGVIAFTPTVIERLLEYTGSIDMQEEYGLTVTKENFWENIQDVVETGTDGPGEGTESTAKPKKIIGDLMRKIIEIMPKLLGEKEVFINIVRTVENSLDEKHILFYLNNEKTQTVVNTYDWGGAVKETDWDYLMVVNTNIAGGKSDRTMLNDIYHKSEIQEDGSIINTVTITRAHATSRYDKFRGVRNVNWMRVYVPQGSELIEASGFLAPDEKFFSQTDEELKTDEYIAATEGQADIHVNSGTKIYKENGKTVFANWTMVDPGQTIYVTLKYKLPFKASLYSQDKQVPHALLVQKQPGSLGVKIKSELILPESLAPSWNYGFEADKLRGNGWFIEDTLETDKYWAVVCSG